METLHDQIRRRIKQGWLMLGLGLLLLVVGLTLPVLLPGVLWSFKWVEGFGIVLLVLGLYQLARYLTAARNPTAARQKLNEDRDERMQAITHQAGNATFTFTMIAAGAALIIYSAMTRGQPYDALWLFMAAVVIVPSLFYIGAQLYYSSRM